MMSRKLTTNGRKVIGFIEFNDEYGELAGMFWTHTSRDLDELVQFTQANVAAMQISNPTHSFVRAVWCLITSEPSDDAFTMTGAPIYQMFFNRDKSFNPEVMQYKHTINDILVGTSKVWLEHIFTIEDVGIEEE